MIKARNIGRLMRLDPARCRAELRESLDAGRTGEPGGVQASEFSLRDLAEELITVGGEPIGYRGVNDLFDPRGVTEAMSAVDSTAFAGITGQLVISSVLASYQAEEYVASRLVPNRPTRFSGEKIPGVGMAADPGSDPLTVREAQDFPTFGFGEEYVQTPDTIKRGMIIPVTKEAIFFDRTGLVLDRAARVGEVIGLNKEKRLLDVLIGAVNNYQEKRASDSAVTARDTFQTTTPWINVKYSNELEDWEAIDAAEQLFADMLDPNTGEPVLIGGRVILVPPAKAMTARRLLSATEIRVATDTAAQTTVSGNPLAGMGLRAEVSRLLYRRLITGLSLDADTAKGYWFYGDPGRAFAYMENWPITVTQAPQNSEAEFNQDIVVRFKASERGAAAVIEPRAWQRHCTAAAPAE
jgi:hypothetical protein